MNSAYQASESDSGVVLEIDVNNHPGVMAHLVGLFTRRACNLEQIVCFPLRDGGTSRIWFLINREEKIAQMVKLATGLEDVISVRRSEKSLKSFQLLRELFL